MLRRMQIAGFHGDRAALDGMGKDAAAAYEIGAAARGLGMACGCIDCRMAAIARRLTADKDPTMGLTDYRRWIDEIGASNLTPAGKAAALELTARRIDGTAWNADLRAPARDLAAEARAAMPGGVDLLAGMDELAAAGKLKAAS